MIQITVAVLLATAFALPAHSAPAVNANASAVAVQSGALGNVNASNANVFVSPSPIDASRDTVKISSMPGTENGAWVNGNNGGMVGEGVHTPLVATNVAPVATPIALSDSFGAVVNTENLAAVPQSAVVQPSVVAASMPQDANATNANASQTSLALIPPVAVSNASMANDSHVIKRAQRDTQLVLGGAPAVASADSSNAFVQTNINNQQMNQSFAAGNGPIVAILPAGSNLSATWDLSSNARPTVGFASAQQPTQPSVALIAVSESTTSVPVSVPVSVSSGSAVSGNNVPVILPVGVAPAGATAVTAAPGAAVASSSSGGAAVIPVGSAGSNTAAVVHADNGAPVVQQNHRFEIQLIDLQLNNTANSDLTQNIVVSVKVTAGVITPSMAVTQNLTLAGAANHAAPVMAAPETTSGLQQVFNGTYKTSVDNKVQVSRTITQDLCGQISDKAFMTVVAAPLSAADSAAFPQQSYTCVVNLNFPTAARSTESFWSDILQCNSGIVNGFSYRLWYKVRQYNIDWANCQQNRPDPVSVA